jgi:plastocyanin
MMKISRDQKILLITAIGSAAVLFAAISKNLNAGQGNYGSYKNYGYDPGYQPHASPGYQYYAPGMPHRSQGYGPVPRYYQAPQTSASIVAPAADLKNVAINGMQFQPATIRIKAGAEVTWTNNAPMLHTITSHNNGLLASERLTRGSTFSLTFEQPGVFGYYCALYPSMMGTVIVE